MSWSRNMFMIGVEGGVRVYSCTTKELWTRKEGRGAAVARVVSLLNETKI